MTSDTVANCVVYRCSRQEQMYLYLRADTQPEDLPDALRSKVGRLHPVMELSLNPQRKLARVDVLRVIQQLRAQGWFLQLPPTDGINAHLDDGD